ncbi:unnamed protein product [Closterium sp. NIES-54]
MGEEWCPLAQGIDEAVQTSEGVLEEERARGGGRQLRFAEEELAGILEEGEEGVEDPQQPSEVELAMDPNVSFPGAQEMRDAVGAGVGVVGEEDLANNVRQRTKEDAGYLKTSTTQRLPEEAQKKAEEEAKKKIEEEMQKNVVAEARMISDAETLKITEAEVVKKAAAEAQRIAVAETKKKAAVEALKIADAEAQKKAEAEAHKKAEAEAQKKAGEEA